MEGLITASWRAAQRQQQQGQGRATGVVGGALAGVVSEQHVGIICTYRRQASG